MKTSTKIIVILVLSIFGIFFAISSQKSSTGITSGENFFELTHDVTNISFMPIKVIDISLYPGNVLCRIKIGEKFTIHGRGAMYQGGWYSVSSGTCSGMANLGITPWLIPNEINK